MTLFPREASTIIKLHEGRHPNIIKACEIGLIQVSEIVDESQPKVMLHANRRTTRSVTK